jgi:hydroxymethylpyrimidine/phosphomethylpyrimidine kinase
VFHSPTDMDQIKSICSKMYLITPNIPEALAMGTTESAELNAKTLSDSCHVFLKGGHNPERAGDDQLILKGGKTISFKSAGNKISPKHGSGCILSAALAAKLAKGLELDKACLLAKEYTLTVLESNDSLLGFHAN